MQLSTVGAPQLAAEPKQSAPAGAPEPAMVLASTRSRSVLEEPPLSMPTNTPGTGAAWKPEPSAETLLFAAPALPKPTAHHWTEPSVAPAGTGANQARLA